LFSRGTQSASLIAGGTLAAAGAGAAATFEPALGLVVALALLFAGVAFTDLAAGTALFAFLTFFERIGGGAASDLTLGKLAGVVLVLAALRKSGAPFLARERPFVCWAAVVFAAWAGASMLWARGESTALAEAIRLSFAVTVLIVVYAAARSFEDVRRISYGYVAGATATVLVGLTVLPRASAEAGAEAGRLAGGVGDPNELAAFLLPAVALAAFSLASARAGQARALLILAIAVTSAGIVLTGSRGGLIGLGVMLLVAVVLAGPVRPQALLLAIVLAACAVGYFAFAAPVETRQRVTSFTSSGGTGRVDLWSVAREAARDHPLTGVGAGNFRIIEPAYAAETIALPNVELIVDRPKAVHNTPLELLVELGPIGLALLAAIVLAGLASCLSAIRAFARERALEAELYSRGLLVGLIGMLSALLFVSGQAKEQLWVLLALALAIGSLSRARRDL
jgi:putative inorganic carbon (hco3(-)) transporter